jgi:hypothetical protein
MEPRERELRLRYADTCRECGAALPVGSRARWNSTTRSTRCLTCPSAATPTSPLTAASSVAVPDPRAPEPDWGVAGASAQRQFDKQENRRRARLRANWPWIAFASIVGAVAGGIFTAATHTHGSLFIVLGAVLPVLKLLPTPRHVDAWRSGASGERAVGRRLEALRAQGILVMHDRRVPGRRTNIDHIVVSSAGVFVVDTKNVAGKVTASRSGLRVAGRRRDEMISGVQGQVAVVRQTVADLAVPPNLVRGVLCFTRADLPWLRPSPGGITLLYPRGLARALRRPGPLTSEQVRHVATVLAQRLPAA